MSSCWVKKDCTDGTDCCHGLQLFGQASRYEPSMIRICGEDNVSEQGLPCCGVHATRVCVFEGAEPLEAFAVVMHACQGVVVHASKHSWKQQVQKVL